MLNITSGRVQRPQKIVLYGVEGIGKTSLAAQMPDPLFIDTEGGTAHLDVRRLQKPSSWVELLAMIREVAATPDVCKTLVIDTADWAEQMTIDYICAKYKQPGIESFGYGKGYTYLGEEFSQMLTACDEVIVSGKHVVITAHAKMRKQELPDEAGAFDRWELKLSKQTAPLLKEWPDALLFLNFKTLVVATENNSHKAQGGRRVIFSTHHPCWDAKNRHGLPDEMELNYTNLAPIFGSAAVTQVKKAAVETQLQLQNPLEPVSEEALETLTLWMDKAGIKVEELQTLVAQKGHYSIDTPIRDYPEKFVKEWIMHNWSQIVTTIEANPEHTPF